jgi:DNA mismatch repair protein MutS2
VNQNALPRTSFFLDPETRASLEWDEFLGMVETHSSLGRETKGRIQPYRMGQEAELRAELRRTKALASFLLEHPSWGAEQAAVLYEIKDLRRSLRQTRAGFVLTTVELFECKRLLLLLQRLRKGMAQPGLTFLASLRPKGCPALLRLLSRGGQSPQTFSLVEAYSASLGKIHRRKEELERGLSAERAEANERLHRDGLRLGRDDEITVPRGSPGANRFQEADCFTLRSESAQAMVFRLRPSSQAVAWKEELEVLAVAAEREGKTIRARLSKAIGEHAEALLEDLERVGRFDLLLAKSQLANSYHGVLPRLLPVSSPLVFRLKEGRHWPMEARMMARGMPFQPLSIELSKGTALVSGSNMSGKTVLLKTIGLSCAMAQHGFLAPAQAMEWALCDFLFISTRRHEQDGLSAFGAEVAGIKGVLSHHRKVGLLLIDELARGTNPTEGFAINAALLLYLHQLPGSALFTSHFEGLAQATGVMHWQMAGLGEISLEEVRALMQQGGEAILSHLMQYRLEGAEPERRVPHDALKIALLLGLDEEVIELARRFAQTPQRLAPAAEHGERPPVLVAMTGGQDGR